MSKEFPCKYGCGTTLHFDNGKVVDGSNAHHDCPNAPSKQKRADNLELIAKHLARIADALELIARNRN